MRPERPAADQVGEHLRVIGSYEPAVSNAHFEHLSGNIALDDYLREYAELPDGGKWAKVFDDENRIVYDRRNACCYDPDEGIVISVWTSSEFRSLDPQGYYVRIFKVGDTASKRLFVQEVRPERDAKPVTLLYLGAAETECEPLRTSVKCIKLAVDSSDMWVNYDDEREIQLRPVTELIDKRDKLNAQLQELGPITLGGSVLVDTID